MPAILELFSRPLTPGLCLLSSFRLLLPSFFLFGHHLAPEANTIDRTKRWEFYLVNYSIWSLKYFCLG